MQRGGYLQAFRQGAPLQLPDGAPQQLRHRREICDEGMQLLRGEAPVVSVLEAGQGRQRGRKMGAWAENREGIGQTLGLSKPVGTGYEVDGCSRWEARQLMSREGAAHLWGAGVSSHVLPLSFTFW